MKNSSEYPGGQFTSAEDVQFNRLPPHDVDAEMATIGSMILCGDNTRLFEDIRSTVGRDDFFQADHQAIYDAMVAVSEAGGAVDGLTTRLELIKRGLLEECGGVKYLADLIGSVPTATNGPVYARTVREHAAKRQLLVVANEIVRRCYAPSATVDAAAVLCSWIEDELVKVQGGHAADQIITLADAVDEVLKAKMDGVTEREPTALLRLNSIVGGLPWGGMTLIGGRPGMGKSVLLKQFIQDYAGAGLRCGIVSLEETRQKIARNALSGHSGIENSHLAYGNIGEQDWREIEKALPEIRRRQVFINDAAAVWSEVARAVTALVVKHKCQVIGVDYLQLIGDDEGRDSTREQEVARISRGLKRLFKRFRVIGIAAVQLNRGSETNSREPELRDLRESGQLEQDGDVILLLHRDDYYHYKEPNFVPTKSVKVIVAKNKDGGMGHVDEFFNGDTQTITDYDPAAGYGEWKPAQVEHTRAPVATMGDELGF